MMSCCRRSGLRVAVDAQCSVQVVEGRTVPSDAVGRRRGRRPARRRSCSRPSSSASLAKRLLWRPRREVSLMLRTWAKAWVASWSKVPSTTTAPLQPIPVDAEPLIVALPAHRGGVPWRRCCLVPDPAPTTMNTSGSSGWWWRIVAQASSRALTTGEPSMTIGCGFGTSRASPHGFPVGVRVGRAARAGPPPVRSRRHRPRCRGPARCLPGGTAEGSIAEVAVRTGEAASCTARQHAAPSPSP